MEQWSWGRIISLYLNRELRTLSPDLDVQSFTAPNLSREVMDESSHGKEIMTEILFPSAINSVWLPANYLILLRLHHL